MARLARQVKKKLAFLDKRRHRRGVAEIGKIDRHPIANVVDIKKVPAVFRDQTVYEGHLRADLDQAPSEGRTNKAESSGDEDVGTGKNVRIPRHGRIVGRGT